MVMPDSNVNPLVEAGKRAFHVFQEWDNADPMPWDALDADGKLAWERIAAGAVSAYMEVVSTGMKIRRYSGDG